MNNNNNKVYLPDHYNQGNIECIDYIKSILTEDEFNGFLKGNIIKYLYRANKKNGEEDRLKAENYTNYLINGEFIK